MTIIAFIGIITGTLLTRRLHRVALTAKTMSAGDLNARALLSGSDEIANLGNSFDDMAEKLKTLMALGHITSFTQIQNANALLPINQVGSNLPSIKFIAVARLFMNE